MSAAQQNSNLTQPCIGLVGAWPPPWGGISVHIQRLADHLSHSGCRVVALDTEWRPNKAQPPNYYSVGKDRWLAARVMRAVAESGIDVLNLHLFGPEWKILVPFAAVQELTGVPIVVTMHSLRRCAATLVPRERWVFSQAARRLQHFLCAGDHVRSNLLEFGVPPERTTTIIPYLAPSLAGDPGSLPPEVEAFMASRQPLVSSGTGVLVKHDGRDLYGLDLFVRVANVVRRHYPDIGFVFVIAGECDAELVGDALEFIADNGLEHNVLLYRKPISPGTLLWARSDVFVRPTLSDGDAISLREALEGGVPCVASDAVKRPDSVRLFRTSDWADCARVLLGVLANLPAERDRLTGVPRAKGQIEVEQILRKAALHKRSHRLPRKALAQGLKGVGWVRS